MKPLFKVVAPDMAKAVKHWATVVGPGLESTILDAAEEVVVDFIGECRESAVGVPGWERLARLLVPHRTTNNVAAWIPPGPESAEAFDLEWGTEGTKPMPLLHNRATRFARQGSKNFERYLNQRLFGTR